MKRCLMAAVLMACTAAAVHAAPIQKGSSIFTIQVNEGVADLYSPTGDGYVTAYSHSEVGLQAQYFHFFRDDYAFNVTAGFGWFSEKDEPGPAALPGSPDLKYTQSSWKVRVGGDRVAHLTDRIHLFAGPGFEYWSGKAKFEPGAFETKNVGRFALSGRMGVHLKMGDSVGIFGQLGHYIGYASVKDGGAKATWWPSGHDGAGGIAFNF